MRFIKKKVKTKRRVGNITIKRHFNLRLIVVRLPDMKIVKTGVRSK